MKTLLVLRHAKSSWKEPDRSDHGRPLNPRGQRDAPRLGRLVAARAVPPGVIMSSTATRARRTAEAVAAEVGAVNEVALDRRLYLAGPAEVVEVVRDRGGAAACVMVVGHNPGLEELVARLTGTAAPLPTAALADIRLSIDTWAALVLTDRGRLEGVWRPRELKD